MFLPPVDFAVTVCAEVSRGIIAVAAIVAAAAAADTVVVVVVAPTWKH